VSVLGRKIQEATEEQSFKTCYQSFDIIEDDIEWKKPHGYYDSQFKR
jgi:hypothetical protein